MRAHRTRWLVGAVRRWLHTRSRPSEKDLDAVVQALACSGVGFVPFQMFRPELPATDEQLCHDWCDSYRALESTYSGRKFDRIVEDRRRYLDELERRNPAGFAAWLASGATADDNPLPYLSLAHCDHSGIDWDELTGGQDS